MSSQPQRLLTKTAFARLAGVTPPRITHMIQRGQLSEAVVGKRIDRDHPDAVTYLISRGVDPMADVPTGLNPPPAATGVRPKAPVYKSSEPPKKRGPAGSPQRQRGVTKEEVDSFDHMTLRQLMQMFGTAPVFIDHLNALKRMEDVREKALKNDELDGQIVSRELVQVHVFGALQSLSRRLLGDFPKTVTQQLYALAKTGAPMEEAEKVVRDAVSSQIEPIKVNVSNALKREVSK